MLAKYSREVGLVIVDREPLVLGRVYLRLLFPVIGNWKPLVLGEVHLKPLFLVVVD